MKVSGAYNPVMSNIGSRTRLSTTSTPAILRYYDTAVFVARPI